MNTTKTLGASVTASKTIPRRHRHLHRVKVNRVPNSLTTRKKKKTTTKKIHGNPTRIQTNKTDMSDEGRQSDHEENEKSDPNQDDDEETETDPHALLRQALEDIETLNTCVKEMDEDLGKLEQQVRDLKPAAVSGLLLVFVICFGLTIASLVWLSNIQSQLDHVDKVASISDFQDVHLGPKNPGPRFIWSEDKWVQVDEDTLPVKPGDANPQMDKTEL